MIFISGATGNIGRHVVRELKQRDVPIRAGTPKQEEAGGIPGGVETVRFDFTDQDTYSPALDGAKKIFLMRPPQLVDMDSTLNSFVDYALERDIKHIVFVSLLGVEDNPRVPHYDAEQHILDRGAPYTFLRPSFFMQNLNTTHREEVRDRDEIFIPAGDSRTSFIDTRDIGAAAARVLSEDGHLHRTYDLTGREALDYYQVAEIFTRVLGREISYENPSLLSFAWHSWRRGRSLPFTFVMAMLYRATRDGAADIVTGDVEQLLGRSPIPFEQYVRDYAHVWER